MLAKVSTCSLPSNVLSVGAIEMGERKTQFLASMSSESISGELCYSERERRCGDCGRVERHFPSPAKERKQKRFSGACMS